jgi:predicted metal-dependent HD superfamily phosphohydrolase
MTESLSTWLATLPPEWMEGCDARAIDRARAAYETPKRHYHTWEHVVACVDRLKAFPCAEPRIVFLALVFHDAIYIPGRSDNEQASAALARDTLSSMCSVSDVDLDAIERMILATRDHHALAGTLSADEAVILDLDLSTLGTSRDEYARYAQQIHDEYVPAAATDARFRIGRAEFLQRMLTLPHVFVTAEGRRRWDDAARANIAWEIAELTKQQGLVEKMVSAVRRMTT